MTYWEEQAAIDAKKRGKVPPMIATYCPFCGEEYAKDSGPLSRLNDGVGRGPASTTDGDAVPGMNK